MAATNRTWQPAETRLVAEYLAVHYPDKRALQRVRVGRIPSELPQGGLSPEELRMLGVWRRWVDAVVFDGPTVLLIEAAIRPDPGDISQLDLYMRLFPTTPEFSDVRPADLRGGLVYAIDDPPVRSLARDRGYTVAIFRPPWVDDYLRGLFPRHRRASLTEV
jgi:hypothetical protein